MTRLNIPICIPHAQCKALDCITGIYLCRIKNPYIYVRRIANPPKRRGRNRDAEAKKPKRIAAETGFVCVYPPPVSCNYALRSRGLYFPQGIRVLCGEYSSTCRRVRCRTPQGAPVLRARLDAPEHLHGGASHDAIESASGLLLGINKSSQSASWHNPGETSLLPPRPRVPENPPW